jgi:hypothetical protein
MPVAISLRMVLQSGSDFDQHLPPGYESGWGSPVAGPAASGRGREPRAHQSPNDRELRLDPRVRPERLERPTFGSLPRNARVGARALLCTRHEHPERKLASPGLRGYGGALVPPQAEGRRATRVWRRGGPRCRRRPALPLCRRGYSGAVRRDRDVRIAPAFRNTCEHPICDAYRPICAEGWLRVPAAAGMRWWIDLCDDFQPTPDGINRRARRARRDPY